MKTKSALKLRYALTLLVCVILTALAVGCAAESNYDLAVRDGYTGSLTEWLATQKGKSAYELAVLNGFTGSEAEWLASLKVGDITLEELYGLYTTEHPEKTMDDFMSTFFEQQQDPLQNAAHKALRSAISLRARFGTFTVTNTLAGSGVILSLDRETGSALIVTNYHVLYDGGISRNIRVCPYGKEYFGGSGSLDLSVKAEFVGGSVSKDIAVLRVNANDVFKAPEYRAADIANSDRVVVGEAAIAVGNPEGEGISATRGIVNVDSEYINMNRIDATTGSVSHRVIRIDAAINGGNSGGGLYNKNGELIGIVNAKAIDEEIDNIGYAIPSNVAIGIACSIVDDVKEEGKYVKYLIGISTSLTGSRAVLEEGVMRIKEELEVSKIEPGKPAAGIVQIADILISAKVGAAEEIEICRDFTLSDLLYKARAGDKLVLTVLRNGARTTLSPIAISSKSYVEI